MENNEYYYAEGSSIDNDPYVMPNGVLINKLGITTTRELNEIEQDLSALAIKLLAQEGPSTQFNFTHLCTIHKRIFEQVYPWAGELRTVDIGRRTQRLFISKLATVNRKIIIWESIESIFLELPDHLPDDIFSREIVSLNR